MTPVQPLPQQMPATTGLPQLPSGGQPRLSSLQQPYAPAINRVQNRTIPSRDYHGILETQHLIKERTLDQVVGRIADQVARNQLTFYEMYRLTPVETRKNRDGKDESAGKNFRSLGGNKTWANVLVVQQFLPQDAIAEAIHELDENGDSARYKMKELSADQEVQISNILNDNIQSKVNSHFVWQLAQLSFQFKRKWGKKKMNSITLYLKHTPRSDVECVAIIRQREQAKIHQARQSMGIPPQQIPRPGVSFGPPKMQGETTGPPPIVKREGPPRGIRVVQSDSSSSSEDDSDTTLSSIDTRPSISTRPSTVSTGQNNSRSSRSFRSNSSGRGHDRRERSRSREKRSRDREPSPMHRRPISRDYMVINLPKYRDDSARRRHSSRSPSRLPSPPSAEDSYYPMQARSNRKRNKLEDRFGRTEHPTIRPDSPWPDFSSRRDGYGDIPSLSGSTLRGSTMPSSSVAGSTRARSEDHRPSRFTRESEYERRRRFEDEDIRDVCARLVEEAVRHRFGESQRPVPPQEFTGRVHIRDMEGRVPRDYVPERRSTPNSHGRDPYSSDSEDELYYRREDPDRPLPRSWLYKSPLDGEEYDIIERHEVPDFRHPARDEPNPFRPRREIHKARPHDDDEYDFIGRDEASPFRRPVASSRQPEQAPRSDTPKSILKVSKQLEPEVRAPSSSSNHTQPSPPPLEPSAREGLPATERLSVPAIITVYSQEPSQASPKEPPAPSRVRSPAPPHTPSNRCREVVLYKPSPKPKREKQRARFEAVAEERPEKRTRRVSFQTEDQSGVHMWTKTPMVKLPARPHIILHNSAPPFVQLRKQTTSPSDNIALASGRETTPYSPSGLKRRKAIWTAAPHDAGPTPSYPLNSVTIGSFTNSSDSSLRYRPTTYLSSRIPTQEPCHCQNSGNDGVPPDQNSTPPTHSKAIGYCFTVTLFLFLILGIFAACVQAIAVFLLLEESSSPSHQNPTWRDNDYFQMLSGSCWQILGMAFTLPVTLKHTSEHNNHRSWYFPWFVGFICVLSSAFAMSLYVRSPAWSLATSGFASLAQVSVHFLTIRILEKTEIREKRNLQWQTRDKVDEDLEQHKVKCRIRKAELDHEIDNYSRSLGIRRAAMLRDVEREEAYARLTRQRLAGEEAERRKKVMDEIVELEKRKVALELDFHRSKRLSPSDSGYGSASGASVTDDARSTGGDSTDDRCDLRGGTTPYMVGEESMGPGYGCTL